MYNSVQNAHVNYVMTLLDFALRPFLSRNVFIIYQTFYRFIPPLLSLSYLIHIFASLHSHSGQVLMP